MKKHFFTSILGPSNIMLKSCHNEGLVDSEDMTKCCSRQGLIGSNYGQPWQGDALGLSSSDSTESMEGLPGRSVRLATLTSAGSGPCVGLPAGMYSCGGFLPWFQSDGL